MKKTTVETVKPAEIQKLIKSVMAGMAVIERALAHGLIRPGIFKAEQVPVVIAKGRPKPVTIRQAIKAVIIAKKNSNRTVRYVRALKCYLNSFAKGREKMPIETITTEAVEEWISKYKNPQTRQTWIHRLSALFSFAARRDWIEKNPCDKIESIFIDRKSPSILTPKQAETLLADCPIAIKPYFILATWVGMRPEEIVPMKVKGQPSQIFDWSEINLSENVLKIERSKVRRRRIVPLEPRAVELLKPYAKECGPVGPSHATIRRWHRRARKILGLKHFPKDILRHTAATYLVAHHNDVAKVALMLGNSANVIMTHYRSIVPQADVQAFWKI